MDNFSRERETRICDIIYKARRYERYNRTESDSIINQKSGMHVFYIKSRENEFCSLNSSRSFKQPSVWQIFIVSSIISVYKIIASNV